MDQLLHRLAEHACKVTGADGLMVFTLDGEEAVVEAACGAFASTLHRRVLAATAPHTRDLVTRALAHGGKVRAGAVDEHAPDQRAEVERSGLVSSVRVPLQGADGPIGVLVLAASRAHAFPEGADAVIDAMAGAIAVCLERRGVLEEQRMFRAFMDVFPGLAWIKDDAGRFTFFNPEFKRVWGAALPLPIGQVRPRDLPISPELTDLEDEAVRTDRAPLHAERRFPGPDGEDLTYAVWKFPIPRPDGRVFVGGLGFDISARKRAEARLRRAEETLRDILDRIPDAVVIHRGGVVEYANEAVRGLLGIPGPTWLVGHSMREFVDDPARMQADLAELAGGGAMNVLRSGHRLDGTPIMVSAHAVPIEWAGAPAVLAVLRDMTEHERTHAAALSEARLRGLDERMHDIEVVMRTDGSFVHANERACATYGYDLDEWRTLRVPDLRVGPTDPADIARVVAAARQGVRFDSRHHRKDGHEFPVELSVRTFEVDGETYVHSLIRDLSEEHAAKARTDALIAQLQEALDNVKTLSGLLPLCMFCKKVRDDAGYWRRIEHYLAEHTDASVSHGLCPDCGRKHYPDHYEDP